MAVTAAQMKARWPNLFGSLADTVLNPAIAAAEMMIAADQLGSCRDEAVINLAAHNALMDTRGLAGSGISSASAGGVSVAFESAAALAQAGGGSAFLAEYRRIVSANVLPIAISGL